MKYIKERVDIIELNTSKTEAIQISLSDLISQTDLGIEKRPNFPRSPKS